MDSSGYLDRAKEIIIILLLQYQLVKFYYYEKF